MGTDDRRTAGRLEAMRVCREHGRLYDDPDGGIPFEDRQLCHESGDQARWDRYDFNEIYHLCPCCLMGAAQSGSRWSVFYCEECRGRIAAARKQPPRLAMPLGRHTIMNSIVPGPDDLDDVEGFVGALGGLVSAIGRLAEWRRRRIHEVTGHLSEDPTSVELASLAAQQWTKGDAFEALAEWWRGGG
jgi:hypothetical protein